MIRATGLPAVSSRPTSGVATPSTPTSEPHDSFLKQLGKTALSIGEGAVLGGASATAGWLGGGYGISGAAVGGTALAGYFLRHEYKGVDLGMAAVQTGGAVGLLGGLAGAVAGPAGVGIMAALGATRALIGAVASLAENGRLQP